jgi:hypothetical protein
MNRDLKTLRLNLSLLLPHLTPDEIGLIIECLGYELLGRGIFAGHSAVALSLTLLGWRAPVAAAPVELPGLPLRQPA